MKKFLSLVVAALLLVSAVATTATAAKFTDVDASNEALSDAVDLLVALGVTKGTTDTTFGADEDVTRQQMAAFMYRMMKGGKAEPSNSVNYSKFTDLVDPYYNYVITWASTEGIIKGRDAENTIFDPKGGIILQDAYTMMVRALGYDDGSLVYPVDYIEKAEELDLDKYLPSTVEYTAALKRGDVAILLKNMFYANTADVEIYYDMSDDKLTPKEEHKTLGQVAFGVEKETYRVFATTNYALGAGQHQTKILIKETDGDPIEDFDRGNVEFKTLGLAGKADDYFLSDIDLFVKTVNGEKTIIGAAANGTKKTVDFGKVTLGYDSTKKELTGTMTIDGVETKIAADGASLINLVDDKDGWLKTDSSKTNTHVTFAKEANAMTGTWEGHTLTSTLSVLFNGGFGEVDVYDSDNNGKADYVFVKPYTAIVIDAATKAEADKKTGFVTAIDDSNFKKAAVNYMIVEGTAKDKDIVLAYVNEAARVIKIAKVLDAPVVASVKGYDAGKSFTLSNGTTIAFEKLEASLVNGADILPKDESELGSIVADDKLVEKNFYFVGDKLVAVTGITVVVDDGKKSTDPKTNWALVLGDVTEDPIKPELDADGKVQYNADGTVKMAEATYSVKVFLDGKIQEVPVAKTFDFGKNTLATLKEINKDTGLYTFEAYTPDYAAADLKGSKTENAKDELAGTTIPTNKLAKNDKGYFEIGSYKLTAVEGAQFIIETKTKKLDKDGKPVSPEEYEPVVTVYTADTLPKFQKDFKSAYYVLSNNTASQTYENLVVFYGYYDKDDLLNEVVVPTDKKVVFKGYTVGTVEKDGKFEEVVTYTVYGDDGKEFTVASGTKDFATAKAYAKDAKFGDLFKLNDDGTIADASKVGNIYADATETITGYHGKIVEIGATEYELTDATVFTKAYKKGTTETFAATTAADIKIGAKIIINDYEAKDGVKYIKNVTVVVIEE